MYDRRAIKSYEQGHQAQQAGKLAEAERAYQKAVRFDRKFFEAYNNLGNVLVDRGKLKQAAHAFSQALRLKRHPMLIHNLANALQLQGELQQAVDYYLEANELNPGFVGTQINLGNALRDLGRFSDAVGAYRVALELEPDNADIHNNLGSVLTDLDQLDEACAAFRRAIEIDAEHIEAYNGLGNAEAFSGRIDEAIAAYRKAIEINPEHRFAHAGLANALSDVGELDAAIESYRNALRINPGNADAWRSLAKNKKFTGRDDDVLAMEALHDDPASSDEQRMFIGFALGKAYEDLREYETAMRYTVDANRRRREALDYSLDETRQSFARIKQVFDRDYFAGHADAGCTDPTPIFVLGMPRSGTSLVEQILASHPDVFGAGELNDLGRLSGAMGGAEGAPPFPLNLVDFDAAALSRLGQDYIDSIRRFGEGEARITDKMPHNFLYIGLIRAILPNARIVHCRRDPLDNCLSIYKNYFSRMHYYSYDQVELGEYYGLYRDLMAHWRDVVPGACYDIDYEALVADQETQTRALLEYCDLPWHDACLAFHETRRKVRTASNAQVRRPIYRDSVDLWKRYADQLDPLREALAGAISDQSVA